MKRYDSMSCIADQQYATSIVPAIATDRAENADGISPEHLDKIGQ
jgi:hypothetical protein